MSDSLDRAVLFGLGAGILACAVAAIAVPSSPLATSARAKWSTGSAVFRHIANRTFTIDATIVGGRERPYARAPLVLRAGSGLAVRGWAFDPALRRSAERLVYRIDGGAWRDASYHVPRPDVAAAFGMPALADTGFRADLPAGALGPGTHHVKLATMTGTGVQQLPDELTVVVRGR